LTLRDALNRILWDRRLSPEEYEVTFVHRGAPSDLRTVRFVSITSVGPSWFLYRDGDEVLIPYHRVVSVTNTRTGEVLWGKRRRGAAVR
jgi:uncharacterized protein (UPF0248 family)